MHCKPQTLLNIPPHYDHVSNAIPLHFAFFDTSSSCLHNRTNDGRSLIQTNFVQHYICQHDILAAWGASLNNALRNLSLPSI